MIKNFENSFAEITESIENLSLNTTALRTKLTQRFGNFETAVKLASTISVDAAELNPQLQEIEDMLVTFEREESIVSKLVDIKREAILAFFNEMPLRLWDLISVHFYFEAARMYVYADYLYRKRAENDDTLIRSWKRIAHLKHTISEHAQKRLLLHEIATFEFADIIATLSVLGIIGEEIDVLNLTGGVSPNVLRTDLKSCFLELTRYFTTRILFFSSAHAALVNNMLTISLKCCHSEEDTLFYLDDFKVEMATFKFSDTEKKVAWLHSFVQSIIQVVKTVLKDQNDLEVLIKLNECLSEEVVKVYDSTHTEMNTRNARYLKELDSRSNYFVNRGDVYTLRQISWEDTLGYLGSPSFAVHTHIFSGLVVNRIVELIPSYVLKFENSVKNVFENEITNWMAQYGRDEPANVWVQNSRSSEEAFIPHMPVVSQVLKAFDSALKSVMDIFTSKTRVVSYEDFPVNVIDKKGQQKHLRTLQEAHMQNVVNALSRIVDHIRVQVKKALQSNDELYALVLGQSLERLLESKYLKELSLDLTNINIEDICVLSSTLWVERVTVIFSSSYEDIAGDAIIDDASIPLPINPSAKLLSALKNVNMEIHNASGLFMRSQVLKVLMDSMFASFLKFMKLQTQRGTSTRLYFDLLLLNNILKQNADVEFSNALSEDVKSQIEEKIRIHKSRSHLFYRYFYVDPTKKKDMNSLADLYLPRSVLKRFQLLPIKSVPS